MKLTDLEVASLYDALNYVNGDMGLTNVQLNLLDRLLVEIRARGYTWDATNLGLLRHKVIEKQ